jgi:hypothetical protein
MMAETVRQTYVPLSRGLDDHLRELRGNRLAVYLHLLLNASFSGPNTGICHRSLSQIGAHLGLHYETVRRAVKWLEGRYIEVLPAKNQHDLTRFKILKYKTVRDFAPSATADGTEVGSNPPLPTAELEADGLPPAKSGKQRRSNPRRQLKTSDLQAPKNVKKKTNKKKPVESTDSTGSDRSSLDSRCTHQPRCRGLPWHICRVIAEQSGLGTDAFPPKDLRNAKALVETSDDEVRGTVRYMLDVNGDFGVGQPCVNGSTILTEAELLAQVEGIE